MVGFILAFALLITPVVGRPFRADYSHFGTIHAAALYALGYLFCTVDRWLFAKSFRTGMTWPFKVAVNKVGCQV